MADRCLACRVFFSGEAQRDHYRSEFHRFNLKRKVAQLPPVSREAFEQHVADSLITEKTSISNHFCSICNKNCSSETAYNQHLQTKKHSIKASHSNPLQNIAMERLRFEDPGNKSTVKDQEEEKEGKSEEELIAEKIKNGVRLELTDCLFCRDNFDSLEDNVSHMTEEHSFFIPDLEFLQDLPGLIAYFGEKLGIGNLCLVCNKSFRGLEGVRSHMVDMGHCRIPDVETDEFDEFYDFTESYSKLGIALPENEGLTEEELFEYIQKRSGVKLSQDGLFLVLPDGRTIGHRSLQQYYRQKFHPKDNRESTSIGKMASRFRMIGWNTDTGKEIQQTKQQNSIFVKHHQHQNAERTKVGMKANNQKYWKDPTLQF